jgi:photosystem II stability/assembly factor-like uncharacterized protein
MKKIFLVLSVVSLFHGLAISQWTLQHSGVPSLYDVQFINLNTGWACGVNSTILKTTNGGNNWFPQQSNLASGKNLIGLSMVDSNNGFITGWFESILKTTNGGINWIPLSDGPIGQGNSWNSSCFINSQTGWICGFLGVVKRTTNGGTTWDSLNAGGTFRDIQFLNSQTGWVAGDGGRIRKTTDGGNTWQFQFQGTNADYWYNSLSFLNTNTGWVVGYRTYVFRTTNSGVNWDTMAFMSGQVIRFANSMTGWCGGSITGNNAAIMYKTTNGGFNWGQQSIPVISGFCGSIYAHNDSIAWATFGDKIIQTTNGGTYLGISNSENKIPNDFALYQNYPNPFNPATNIKYQILKNNTHVSLIITDITGRELSILVNGKQNAGSYKVDFDAGYLPSSVYFYRLTANDISETKKMILIK